MSADQQNSTAAEEPLHRAMLTPSEWHILCPVCGAENAVSDIYEDAGGAFCASGADQFLRCEACDAFVEVVAASVQEAYPQ